MTKFYFFLLSFLLGAIYGQDVYKIQYGGKFCGYLESIFVEDDKEIKMMMKSFFIDSSDKTPILLKQTDTHIFNKKLEPISLQVVQKTVNSHKKYFCVKDSKKIVMVLEEKQDSKTYTTPYKDQKIWPNMFVIARYIKMNAIEEETSFNFFDMLHPETKLRLEVKRLGTKIAKTDLGDFDCYWYRLVFRLGSKLRTQTLFLSKKDLSLIQFTDLGPTPQQSTRIQITNEMVKAEHQKTLKELRTKNQPEDLTWLLNRTFHYDFIFNEKKFGTHSFTLKKGEAYGRSVYFLDAETLLETEQKRIKANSKATYNLLLFPLSYEAKSSNVEKEKDIQVEMSCVFDSSQIKIHQQVNETQGKRVLKSSNTTSLIDNNNMGHFAMLCTKVKLEEGEITKFNIFHPLEKKVFPARIQVLDEVLKDKIRGDYYLCDFISQPLGKIRLLISSNHELLEYRQKFGSGRMTIKLKKQ